MITLEETLDQQFDLINLCKDRTLKTNEIFIGNAFYGIDHALKSYAGLPQRYALKVIIPHGVYLDKDYMWNSEIVSLLPVVLCYPPYRIKKYQESTKKKIVNSSSPFLYVVEIAKETIRQTQRRGTIFFPHHSTHHITVKMNYASIADRLIALPDKFHPISVCMYWKDVNLNHHLPFVDKGLKVVSAGHMYDSNFLFRLYHLLSMHKYASGNGIGSHIFYAVKAGCSYFHFDDMNYASVAEEKILDRDIPKLSMNFKHNLLRHFRLGELENVENQNEIANYYLGNDFFLSPDDFRSQLMKAELLDKIQILVKTENLHNRLVIPPFFRRVVWRLRKFGGDIRNRKRNEEHI